MSGFLEKIIGDFEGKREWRETKARAKALPPDYRAVYEEIQKYLWSSSGVGTLAPFFAMLDMFEEGAAHGRRVLDITGRDVAAFADDLVRGEASYFDKLRKNLNRDVIKRLEQSGASQ